MNCQGKLFCGFLIIFCCISVQYSFADPLTITSVIPTDASCNGYSDGSITITITGGTAPFTYSWTGGNSDTTSNTVYTITGLPEGIYWVVVDGSLGGETDSRFGILVNEPDPLVLNPPTSNPVTGCFGNTNGEITATVSGGTLPYTFTLKKSGVFYDSNTTGVFTGLPTGTYTVELDDAASCGPDISGDIIIDEPTQVVLGTPATTDVTCNGGSDGILSITASGGSSPYTYTLKKSGVFQSSNATGNFPGLSAGIYTVEATDDNGCGPAVSGNIEIFEPLAISLGTPTVTDASCNGGSDGSISITASGGTPGYTYSLFIGAVLQDSNTSGTFTGLSADNYTIQVVDADGCGPESSGVITAGEPAPVSLGAPTVIDVTGCFGDATGSISISASGGTPGYTYVLKIGGVTQATNSTGVFNNLLADVYTIEADDANNCGPVVSGPITVDEPAQLSLGSPTVTDVTGCFGNSNGQITVTGSGGILPYTFTLKKSGVFYASNASGDFPGLPAGTYTVELDDAASCGPVISGNITIDEPTQVVLGTPATTDVTCNGGSDGTLSITASGGSSPYTYTLKKSGVFQSSNATGNFPGLSAGIYTVEATDDNGCGPIVSNDIEIYQPLAISLGTPTVTDVSCFGDVDGTIAVTASGGTPGYVYTLKKGGITEDSNIHGSFVDLTPGDYTIEITDTNGCGPFVSNVITISEPAVITINSEIPYDITCNGVNDGRIEIQASGGTPPYTFSVNGGISFADNGGNFTGLSANTYTVVVKDSQDCQVTGSTLTINEPPALSLVADTTKATCNHDTPDGSLRLSVSGGIRSYTYSIDNGLTYQSDSSFTGLYAGIYDVVIKDNNNCLLSQQVVIEGRINVIAYAGEDTSICPGTEYILTASGGDSYLWTSTETISDPTSATITVSPDGVTSYILTATIELCQDTDTVTLSLYPVIGIDAGNDTMVQAGGSVVLTATEGFASYSWLPSEYMSNPVGSSITVTPFENVIVYVIGTTDDGCLETDSLQVFIAQELVIPSGFTPNNDGVNDTWEITNSYLYADMIVEVYTRWGAKVFHARGYNADNYWDGTYNGKDLPMGTYYYIIQLNDPFGSRPISGPVTIIR